MVLEMMSTLIECANLLDSFLFNEYDHLSSFHSMEGLRVWSNKQLLLRNLFWIFTKLYLLS